VVVTYEGERYECDVWLVRDPISRMPRERQGQSLLAVLLEKGSAQSTRKIGGP
jgi:hypothetical protein